jgi:hypothetical protein
MVLKFFTRVVRAVMLVLVVLILAYVTSSNGVDYLHGFGKTCLLAHHGWQIHMQCGVASPPN